MLNSNRLKEILIDAQKCEISEHYIYKELSKIVKDPHNKKLLERISEEELGHYRIWKEYTGNDVKPSKFKIWKYVIIARLFGLTFGLKLMERGESNAQLSYHEISNEISEAEKLAEDESIHESQLLSLIEEERLEYIGSIVLGLNDALVELTGALAGFTLALRSARLIATAGLITGVAASLSMAASEYLSTKAEETVRNPIRASLYTGMAYVLTVLFLIMPYLILKNFYIALGITILNAIIVVFIFTYYVSIAKDLPFKKRFLEMVIISLGVSCVTFSIGFVIRRFFGIEI